MYDIHSISGCISLSRWSITSYKTWGMQSLFRFFYVLVLLIHNLKKYFIYGIINKCVDRKFTKYYKICRWRLIISWILGDRWQDYTISELQFVVHNISERQCMTDVDQGPGVWNQVCHSFPVGWHWEPVQGLWCELSCPRKKSGLKKTECERNMHIGKCLVSKHGKLISRDVSGYLKKILFCQTLQ